MPFLPKESLRLLANGLAEDLLARLRDTRTPRPQFRQLLDALGAMVVAEALADLPTRASAVETPAGRAEGRVLARSVTVVPVLRAGLALLEPALRLLPDGTRVGFVGLVRDERTHAADAYATRLPEGLDGDEVLLLDVMLATGGSACAAAGILKAAGARSVRLAAVIAAPEGIARVQREHPDVPIALAAVDRGLDDRAFIVPGLGDAGDRLYGP